jgi:hypothetical protein
MNTINIDLQGYTNEEIQKMKEIFLALIQSGGLTGVKGGKTIIHFDLGGDFQGIELNYWPWRKKRFA